MNIRTHRHTQRARQTQNKTMFKLLSYWCQENAHAKSLKHSNNTWLLPVQATKCKIWIAQLENERRRAAMPPQHLSNGVGKSDFSPSNVSTVNPTAHTAVGISENLWRVLERLVLLTRWNSHMQVLRLFVLILLSSLLIMLMNDYDSAWMLGRREQQSNHTKEVLISLLAAFKSWAQCENNKLNLWCLNFLALDKT